MRETAGGGGGCSAEGNELLKGRWMTELGNMKGGGGGGDPMREIICRAMKCELQRGEV